ncbi:hypothetical protein H696_01679 [Fonticula alba]|uniref:Uncharacterized protein n=1 Tax=Fonticula alba TaxID=691883 RepID=A0A058ZEA8_FONAL|nr:hypothetical protein H696_01679 [Fonticula alba]KCV72281.1 hypothetical protein H696_01679 [Fonticula alba]|eukprot:XP_009493859.1 hypothetical protein H696_01679 [Fonticula alba]
MGGVGLATWATLHLIFPDRLLDVLLTGPSHQELPLSLRMATLFAAATCTPAAGFQTTPIYGAARPLAARDFYSFLLGLLSTDCPRDDAFPFSTLPPVITILSWFITVALCVFVVAAARLYQRWRLRLSVKSSSRDWSTLPDVVCQIATNTALRSVFYLGALLFVQIIFSGPLYFSLPYILMIYGFSFTVIRTVAYIVESNPYSNIEWVGSVFVEHAIFCNRALLMMVGFWGVATSRGFIGLAPYLSSELHAVILGKSAIVWMCLSLVLSPLLAIAPNILRLILVGEV